MLLYCWVRCSWQFGGLQCPYCLGSSSPGLYWNWLVAFTSLFWCLKPRTVCSWRWRHCSLLKCWELLAQGYGIRPGAAGDLNLSKKNVQAWAYCQRMQVFLFHSMWRCLIFSWEYFGILSLLEDAVSVPDIVALHVGLSVNNELERMWQDYSGPSLRYCSRVCL